MTWNGIKEFLWFMGIVTFFYGVVPCAAIIITAEVAKHFIMP